ncbi:MAG: HDOD domain-containing protein [candidate division Zixibacteria bacterium]|nr:HDOD domain-containing protein [candidate division Zixibacteria bacterium]
MGQEVYHKILNDHGEIASLPQVLVEVVKVSADPNASASDLSRVILKDPALTAKLLRIVNSPYYGRVREVTTINQAVVTLGMRSVTAIALSASVYEMVGSLKGAVDRKRFWRHSLEVATAAKLIADEIGFEPAEEAFVAGLLHDIGMLILESSFPDEYKRIWKLVESGESLMEVEQRNWGTDHARTGQFILDQWGLPKHIGETAKHHHMVFSHGEKSPEMTLPQIVNLANQLSKFRAYTMPPPEAKTLEIKDIVASNLGLSNAALGRIEAELISEVVKESGFLEIEIGNIEELLREANQLLFRQYEMVENLLRENRKMQQQIAHDQAMQGALEALQQIAVTFSHLINNAATAIDGRAQLIDLAISKGRIVDEKGVCKSSTAIITKAVESISFILEELKRVSSFDPQAITDRTTIGDIEAEIKSRLEELEDTTITSRY